MANQWNEKFLNNQVSQLWNRTEDDTSWQNKDLPDWDIFVDDSENIVINALNEQFTDWEILGNSFSENNSKYISFAGNHDSGGFVLFTTKVFDEVHILTQIQSPANNRIENFVQIQTIQDYLNDTFGQIFLITQDNTGTNSLQIISNPFVTDDSELGNLLLIQNLRFVSDSFPLIKWGPSAPTQGQWDDFCRLQNTNFKMAVDNASDSYSENVVIVCYRDSFSNQYGSARIIVFDYNWYDESSLRITSQIFGYTTQDTFPSLDVKTFNERSFITTNIAENNITTYTTNITATDDYINLFTPSTKYSLTKVIKSLGTGQYQRALLWDDLQILNTGEMASTYRWAKAYYDWLKQYNGMEFLSISEDIQFIIVLGYHVLGDEENEVYPNLAPLWANSQIRPDDTFWDYSWTGGEYAREHWYWYKATINDFLDSNNRIDAGFSVVLQSIDGNEGSPGNNQWVNRVTAFLVRNPDETIQFESNSNISENAMYVSGNDIENISFQNGFTQNLFVKNPEGKIVTSTFTITKDGSIEITERNLIHQVPYSTRFFNIPTLVNENELYIGYLQAQGYGQIDYLVWSYNENGDVVDKSAVRSINPLNEVAESIYTYYLKKEVIYQIIDENNKNYIGVLYLKNNDRISNIKEINANQRLFSYFKDDNSVQIRSLGDQNVWSELSYTSQEENVIYFRQERNNQIDNFNLSRIALSFDNFFLSDNTIANKNMTQVSAYAVLGQEVLNYLETDHISLFNNNNIEILKSELKFQKNYWEQYLIGFQIKINTPNNWKNWFDNPEKMQIVKLKINDREFLLKDRNFIQNDNHLKIGFNLFDEARLWMYFGTTGKIFKNKGGDE